MADRRGNVILKRSNVAGKVPNAGDLKLGELAINTADAILYTSGTTQNQILPIGWDRIARTGDTVTGDFTINGLVTINDSASGPLFITSGTGITRGFSVNVITGTTKYIARLKDGSEGTGKFLKSVNPQGDAKWFNITTNDISGYTDTFITGGTSSGGTITLERNDGQDIIITGVSQERKIIDVYESGTTSIIGAYTNINFNAEIIVDSDYLFTGTTITFNSDGYYEVSYNINAEIITGGIKILRHRLVLDEGSGFNEILRSASYSYHISAAQGKASASKTIRQFFSAGDIIKVQSIIDSGSGTISTIANESNITIKKISS